MLKMPYLGNVNCYSFPENLVSLRVDCLGCVLAYHHVEET